MGTFEIIITVLLSLLGAALLIFGTWLFLIASRRPGEKMKKFARVRYAHRGLHGDGAEENSITAFRRAAEAGYGIELDVRLAADGAVVVHHDANLLRVAGIDKRVIDLSSEELGKIRLGDTEDTVPTLKEVLKAVDGRVPFLFEIKQDKDESGVVDKFLEEIAGYEGEFIVESFNPYVLKVIRRKRPDILLGMLSAEYTKNSEFKKNFLFLQLERLRLNFFSRPDFIAYNKTGYRLTVLKVIRKLFKTPVIAWTAQSLEEDKAALENGFCTVIFENYTPAPTVEDKI